MEIGHIFELWRTKYSSEAYTDQMGIPHDGYIVTDSVIVKLIETRKVKGMWGGGEFDGWKAEDEHGKPYTNNWFSFPDDSMSPTYYWDALEDEHGSVWRPVDAMQAVNYGTIHVTPDGEKAIPSIAKKCPSHNYYFEKDGGECFECRLEKIRRERTKPKTAQRRLR